MSGFTDTTEAAILDALLGASNLGIFPDPVFLGLSTANPLEDGSGVAEPSGAAAYARQSIANDGTNWPAATPGDPTTIANGLAVTFPTATGAWGTITHWFLATAGVGGTILMSATLDIAKVVDSGDTPEFAVGQVQVTLE